MFTISLVIKSSCCQGCNSDPYHFGLKFLKAVITFGKPLDLLEIIIKSNSEEL